ncbi:MULTISPECIES: hypothetical protein [Streptomyces]|uniref:hypothetical protein n=1 Tax=Streptomyces TaxID=1883 RepID=UPI001487ED47|nr:MULTISPECIES: hypothetical protein [Streptomyces]
MAAIQAGLAAWRSVDGGERVLGPRRRLRRCLTAVDGEHGVGVVRLELAELQALAEAMERCLDALDLTAHDNPGFSEFRMPCTVILC